jgi:hypothetical protein
MPSVGFLPRGYIFCSTLPLGDVMEFRHTGVLIDVSEFTQKVNELIHSTIFAAFCNEQRRATSKTIEWILKRTLDDIFPFVEICEYYRHDQWYEHGYLQIRNLYGSSFDTDFSKALLEVLPMRFIPSEKLLVDYSYGCLILRKANGSSWF